MHHYDLLSQQEAKIPKTPVRTRVIQSRGKIIMTIFWDKEDVLLVDFLPCGTTINGSSFLHRLHSSVWEKLSRRVLLLHDNAPLHKSNITQASPN